MRRVVRACVRIYRGFAETTGKTAARRDKFPFGASGNFAAPIWAAV
jgi:hypothetical protein